MFNPSYLISSRHNVFYFRYPVPAILHPQRKQTHIKISLGTRDPKEALRLANLLEYNAYIIMSQGAITFMDHGEITDILKDHFYALLDEKRAAIRRDGPLPDDELRELISLRNHAAEAIENNRDEIIPNEDISHRLKPIIKASGFDIQENSKDYNNMKSLYKKALHGYCNKLITHNESEFAFTFGTRPDVLKIKAAQSKNAKPQNRLGNLIGSYIAEMKKAEAWEVKTEEERRDCFDLLVEILGDTFNVPDLGVEQARHVKDILMKLPKNRNKNKATRNLPLMEQIEVEGAERLSVASINKYLMLYGALLSWAEKNGYTAKNPFSGMALKKSSSEKKRESFSIEQARKIIRAIDDKGYDGADKKFQYWGPLIALYTGARLNEVCSLTVKDVKEEGGIWHFDINDEEEMKRLKTTAAIRRVPVHSELLRRGFMSYVEEVSKMKGDNLRLLPDVTYEEKTGWGRKLGRWFNDNFLPKHDLKTKTLSFHSLRHTVITNLRKANVDNHIVRALVGHEAEGITEQVYHHGYDLSQLQVAIESLKY